MKCKQLKKGMALMFAMVMMFNLSLPSAALKLKGLDKDAEQTVTSEDKKGSKKTNTKKSGVFANFTEDMMPSETNKPFVIEKMMPNLFLNFYKVILGETYSYQYEDILPDETISFENEGKCVKLWTEGNTIYAKGLAEGDEKVKITVTCKNYRPASIEGIIHVRKFVMYETSKEIHELKVTPIKEDWEPLNNKKVYYFNTEKDANYTISSTGGVTANIRKEEEPGQYSRYIDVKTTSDGTFTLTETRANGEVYQSVINVEHGYPKEFLQYGLDIWYFTNQEREKRGLKPLSLDKQLMETAALRTVELHTKYSHTRPNGKSCFTVYPSYPSKAENIFMSTWPGISAEEAVELWMNSPGHRANILDREFNCVGTMGDAFYGVQAFGRK